MPTITAKPISEKQFAYMLSLLDQKALPQQASEFDVLDKIMLGEGVSQDASTVINWLKELPRKGPEVVVEPGLYVDGDDVYKVVLSKSSGKPYAKKMVIGTNDKGEPKGRFEYAPGEVGRFAGMTPLGLERACELGQKFGICMVCGATLSNKDSIERQIGPICAGRL